MIVKMLHYDLVLLKQQSEDFIERLRELGLVDITTTGWEPQEKDRQLLVEIDQYQKALDKLEAFAQSEAFVKSTSASYTSAEEVMEAYQKLSQHKASLVAEIARLEKLAEEVAPWGEFDPTLLGIKDVTLSEQKIAGVRTPVLEGITFEEKEYDLFSSPA